ncbi:CvpA family protein [Candidatus Margulisiibacteriota bacterium]
MIAAIDILGGVFIVTLAALAVRAGFLTTILGIAVVYISAFFSSQFASNAAATMDFLGGNKQIAYTVLFLVLFVMLYLIGEFLVWMLKKVISIKLMGVLDSIVAAVLGGFKALLIIGIIFDLVLSMNLSKQTLDYVNRSKIKEISLIILENTYPLAQASIPKIGLLVKTGLEQDEIKIKVPKKPREAVLKTVEAVTKEVKIVAENAVQKVKRFTP